MRLRITFNSGVIEIKFIINDATRPVIRFMELARNIHRAEPVPLTSFIPPEYRIANNIQHVEDHYNRILHAIQALRDDLGYRWPGNIPDTFQYDQNFLNLAHRVFTNGIDFAIVNNWPEQIEHKGFAGWSPNRHDPLFEFQKLIFDKNLYDLDRFNNATHTGQVPARQYFAEVLDIINHEVHALEDQTTTYGKTYTVENVQSQYKQTSLWLNAHDKSMSAYNGPMYYELDTLVQYDWQKKYWEQDADVYLDGSIKGKSYLRCFMDDDDPRENDISGRKVTFGGIHIDPLKTHKKLYESTGFRQWLKNYNLDINDINLEFPLGKIVRSTVDFIDSNGVMDPNADYSIVNLEYIT